VVTDEIWRAGGIRISGVVGSQTISKGGKSYAESCHVQLHARSDA